MSKNKILVLRTNINEEEKIKQVRQLFNNNSDIIKWSIDMEDIDNVLRIEATRKLNENGIVKLLKTVDLIGEDLAG